MIMETILRMIMCADVFTIALVVLFGFIPEKYVDIIFHFVGGEEVLFNSELYLFEPLVHKYLYVISSNRSFLLYFLSLGRLAYNDAAKIHVLVAPYFINLESKGI